MSQAIKALFSFQQTSQRQYRLARSLCTYNNRDISKAVQVGTGSDLLMHNLKNASSTKNVLEIVSAHSRIMNSKHILQALRSVFTLQKHGSSDYSTRDILHHPDFERLCRQLKYQAGAIELNETIEALKVVAYVGLPSSSTIVKVLLQLIRHNVNALSLAHIMFVDFLLDQFESTPLVDALKIALPIVFDIQLPVKMDYESASHLCEYLHYVSKKRSSTDSGKRISEALMTFDEFDAKCAKSIIWSICDMPYEEFLIPLLRRALNSIVIHLHDVSYVDMESTLSKLISRYSKRFPEFYDEVFFDSCANYVIEHDLGFKHSIFILRKFGRVNHSNTALLDYVSNKVYENPELITKGESVDVYSIVVSLVSTEYRPVHWDHLKALISEMGRISQDDRREILWIKFGAALCLLDIFKVDVLNKCLQEKYLHNLFKRKFMTNFENYVAIYQCIKTYKPDLNCLLGSSFSPEKLFKMYGRTADLPLKEAVLQAVGGEKYVMSDLYSRLGHQIDHLVTFRRGGHPIAMNCSDAPKFIEDIECPSDHLQVAILSLKPHHYTTNNRQMLYRTIVDMKTLESKGIAVVPICLEVWESLPDFEKIPYIMRSVKEVVDKDEFLSGDARKDVQ